MSFLLLSLVIGEAEVFDLEILRLKDEVVLEKSLFERKFVEMEKHAQAQKVCFQFLGVGIVRESDSTNPFLKTKNLGPDCSSG